MRDETALVPAEEACKTLGKPTNTLTDVLRLGDVLYKSGYFADIRSAAQAVVKVLRGQELGLGPVASLEQIHVVQGRTALSAGLIGALIKRSGRYDYTILEHTETACEIEFYCLGKPIGRSKFTVGDAELAGLAGRDMWRKYPRNMVFARALSNGARWYCPDVFGGAVYTPEELTDAVVDTPRAVSEEIVDPSTEPATDKQLKKLHAMARERGLNGDAVRNMLRVRYGIESGRELTKGQASDLIDHLAKLSPQPEGDSNNTPVFAESNQPPHD